MNIRIKVIRFYLKVAYLPCLHVCTGHRLLHPCKSIQLFNQNKKEFLPQPLNIHNHSQKLQLMSNHWAVHTSQQNKSTTQINKINQQHKSKKCENIGTDEWQFGNYMNCQNTPKLMTTHYNDTSII